jgi:hypothetical protein
MLHCHCSRCRKEHGAPFATFATSTKGALRWLEGEDTVVSHAVAPGGPRHFCATCGAVAPSTHPEMDLAFIPAGNLEGELGITPQGHLFTGSKASWHSITDALPQHEAYPPEFGDLPGLPDREAAPGTGATTGSCLCGEVAFEISTPPLMMFQCHCSRCRKARSAAHGANVFYKAEGFSWTRGEHLVKEYKVPEARFYAVAFCGQCGASVPKVSSERGIVIVPVSSLDTDPGMQPMAHIFVDSKAPWFEITGELPQYPEGPPSLSPSR